MSTIEPNFQRILLVDDDLVVRARVSESLEQEGFEVILAKDGNEGIMAYQEYRPDLILVDAVMPILDGFEFVDIFFDGDSLPNSISRDRSLLSKVPCPIDDRGSVRSSLTL